MPCPTPSPSCSGGDDSSAAHPALPHLLRAVATMTTQPRTLPHPISFVWRGQRQLSHTPCPAPSPLCGDDNDSLATRPAPPHLLRAVVTTTAQPHALPGPVSFVW